MHSSSKSERQMLREIAWLICPRLTCELCKLPLIYRPRTMTFGHRRHPPFIMRLTTHHRNHKREDNTDPNLALVHSSCHKKYHAEVNSGKRSRPQEQPTDC